MEIRQWLLREVELKLQDALASRPSALRPGVEALAALGSQATVTSDDRRD